MDQQRFDELVRNLGAGNSRRTVLKGLLAGAVGGALSLVGGGGAFAKQDDSKNDDKNNRGHSKKPDCCPERAPDLCDLQCVDTDSDPRNCGVCGHDCGPNGVCVHGRCTCNPDRHACEHQGVTCGPVSDGCGGTIDCGSCSSGETCHAGQCVSNCPTGTIDCNSTCVNEMTDINNCGACGNQCSSGQACVGGTCTSPNCDDGNPCTSDTFNPTTQQCEHRAQSDGLPCETDAGSGSCLGGTCVPQPCDSGQTQSCNTGLLGICATGTQTCSSGTWGPCVQTVSPQTESCNGIDDDCDGQVDNGATCDNGQVCQGGQCVPSSGCTTAAECPGTDTDCQTRTCVNGVCGESNASSGTSCSGVCIDANTVQTCMCDGNGNSFTSEVSCGAYACSDGACLTICNGDQDCVGGSICQSGVCSQSCPANEILCGDVCVNSSTDKNNCGACGNVCNLPHATGACSNGTCVVATCNTGFHDCNGSALDGCEVNTAIDINNCGSCGNKCGECFSGCSNGTCIPANPGTLCTGGTCDGSGVCHQS